MPSAYPSTRWPSPPLDLRPMRNLKPLHDLSLQSTRVQALGPSAGENPQRLSWRRTCVQGAGAGSLGWAERCQHGARSGPMRVWCSPRSRTTSVDFTGPCACEPVLGAAVPSFPAEGGASVLRPHGPEEPADLIFFGGFKSEGAQVLKRFSWKILLSVSWKL